jgi:hypothetical protein
MLRLLFFQRTGQQLPYPSRPVGSQASPPYCQHHMRQSSDLKHPIRWAQIMVFIGFGCLMTFLRRYSYSAIAFNFFVSAFVIVWAILGIGLFQQVCTPTAACS